RAGGARGSASSAINRHQPESREGRWGSRAGINRCPYLGSSSRVRNLCTPLPNTIRFRYTLRGGIGVVPIRVPLTGHLE
ncbi:MAG TPA: hypothetical protein VL485_17985, partial [Ktedonobacteraceae bacterium]|nr:hypothetical protein [Ktedonobacteraceae bacterium]